VSGKKTKLNFIKDDCHVVQLLNAFIYEGPYGRHFCMVFEILGVNLLQVIKGDSFKGVRLFHLKINTSKLPLHICKKIAKQVLIGLDYLHRICKVIHTDLKPENVML
jgi:serine/threonine-protein kinase SRPK3